MFLYVFNWDFGVIVLEVCNMFVGVYIVWIIDFNGCLVEEMVLINEFLLLQVVIQEEQALSCGFFLDGILFVFVIGGILFYIYNWLDGSGILLWIGLLFGNYIVIVIDVNDCFVILSYMFEFGFIVDVGFEQEFDCVNIVVVLQGSVSVVGLEIFYVWIILDGNIFLGVNILNLLVDVFGIYILIVMDNSQLDCFLEDLVVVIEDFYEFVLIVDLINCDFVNILYVLVLFGGNFVWIYLDGLMVLGQNLVGMI